MSEKIVDGGIRINCLWMIMFLLEKIESLGIRINLPWNIVFLSEKMDSRSEIVSSGLLSLCQKR